MGKPYSDDLRCGIDVLCLRAIEPDAAGRYAQTYSYLLASRLLMERSAVGGLTPNGSFDPLLASQWTRRRGPETTAITIDRGKVSVMPDELRPDLSMQWPTPWTKCCCRGNRHLA